MTARKAPTEAHAALAKDAYYDILHFDANSEKSGQRVLAEVIADAEQRGREAGIREAAKKTDDECGCERWILDMLAPDAEDGE